MSDKQASWLSVIEMLSAHLARRPKVELSSLPGRSMVGRAQALIAAVGVPVAQGGTQPAYSPGEDLIYMPSPGWYALGRVWKRPKRYVCDLLHEGVHASGHKSRLARPQHHQWGDLIYSREELVAEIGSCLLMHDLGIHCKRPVLPHGKYLQSWLANLDNPRLELDMAMASANRAAGYMVSVARSNLARRAS